MTSVQDTIAAIATPLGEGGLGVVRISGPQALDVASRLFQGPTPLDAVSSHTLHHGWIRDNDRPIDEVVAAVFRSPKSFTGENVVEFSCHGSPVVLNEIVRLCLSRGARAAHPGEFTQRAYLNGKIDLSQAEAVADLVRARSERARAAAAAQLRGALSARIAAIRTHLIDLLARVEANLDFVEEDIPGLPADVLHSTLTQLRDDVSALLSTSVRARMIREGVRVVLAGKPNVGKSSLFNALLAEDRAIVTDVPGTTRDTLEERLQWNGLSIALVDTAGLRVSQDHVEAEGAARARRAQGSADLVLLVLDASAPLEEEDRAVLTQAAASRVIVLNKSDKGQVLRPESFPSPVVSVSAKEARGLSDLKAAILACVAGDGESENAPVVTNQRHAEALERCAEKLRSAIKASAERRSEEALAADLREATEALGTITGETVTDDVLASIFRQFCIGK